MFPKKPFYNLTCGNLTFSEMVEEIIRYQREKPEEFYDIVVGCDSSSGKSPVFPIVIAVLRRGRGGRFFVQKICYSKSEKFLNLHQRILQEIYLACDLALNLREALEEEKIKKLINARCQFRFIHADVGVNGKTKNMIKEIINLINSNGFEAKIKPDSYAASTVADRFT